MPDLSGSEEPTLSDSSHSDATRPGIPLSTEEQPEYQDSSTEFDVTTADESAWSEVPISDEVLNAGSALLDSDPSAIGDWVLLRRLGAGGMGNVYLAAQGDSLAAVKVIASEFTHDPKFRFRFQREIELCKRVQGPNVAAVIDGELAAETLWLAMGYIHGPTLQQTVASRGPLVGDDLHSLARGTAAALAQIHAAGVIHRDLKPSNVILTEAGPVVIDFGIATAEELTALTATGATVGSAGWMAPEQIQGHPITETADVFSWGALVAFASTGRPPFGTGRAEAISYRVIHNQPDIRGLDPQARALVTSALTQQPALRPSISTILRSLDSFSDASQPQADVWGITLTGDTSFPSSTISQELPTATQVATATTPAVAGAELFTEVTPPPETATRPVGRRRNMFALLIVFLTLGSLGAFTFGRYVAQQTTVSADAGLPADLSTTASTPPSTSAASTASTSTGAPTSAAAEASASTTLPESKLIPANSEDDEPIVITVPLGVDAPAMPTTLKGWRPDGPVQSGLLRVFEGGPQSTGEAIGVNPNSCYGGIWTARWRSTSDFDPIRAATDTALNLAEPNYETPALNSATVGGAGYMSGRVCEQPVFAYGNPGDSGSSLVDVVVEWQQWIPGV